MKLKKILLILFLAFLLFWMFQDPSGMAEAVESLVGNVWGVFSGFFEAVLSFVRELGGA